MNYDTINHPPRAPQKNFPNKKKFAKKISNSKEKNAMPVPTSATKPNTKQNKSKPELKKEKKKKKIGEEGKHKSENIREQKQTKLRETSKPKCAVQRAPNGRWRWL
jgi:hypothetical protein